MIWVCMILRRYIHKILYPKKTNFVWFHIGFLKTSNLIFFQKYFRVQITYRLFQKIRIYLKQQQLEIDLRNIASKYSLFSFSQTSTIDKRSCSPVWWCNQKMDFHVCTFLVVYENIWDKQDSISSGFNWCCIMYKNVRFKNNNLQ